MPHEPDNDEQELRAVSFRLAESVSDLTDEEILAEGQEDGIDIKREADRVRTVLRDAVKEYRQRPLQAAREQYKQGIAAMRNKRHFLPASPENQRSLLASVFSKIPEMESALLTAQHRNFTDLNDADVKSYLTQLIDLGVIDQFDTRLGEET